ARFAGRLAKLELAELQSLSPPPLPEWLSAVPSHLGEAFSFLSCAPAPAASHPASARRPVDRKHPFPARGQLQVPGSLEFSGLSCDFAQPRAREPLRSLRGIDRLRVFRAIAPIRFPRWTDDDWLFVAAEGVDEVRSRIMPVNRKYPLKVLLEACDYYVAKKGRMTFEYILIAGVNDTDEQACELAKIARRLSAKINLISYNTVEGLEWSRPSRARQEKF